MKFNTADRYDAQELIDSLGSCHASATLRARAERAADVLRNGGTHAQMRRALCTVKAFSKEVR